MLVLKSRKDLEKSKMKKGIIICTILGYLILSLFSSMFTALDNLSVVINRNGNNIQGQDNRAFLQEYKKLPCDRNTPWTLIVYSKWFCPIR